MAERNSVPGTSKRPPHNNLAQHFDIQVLGRSYDTWTVALLRTFISHYGQTLPPHLSKDHLMHIMAQVVRKYDLKNSDYTDMYKAYWGRQTLPARKPRANPLLPIEYEDTPTRSKKCCIVCWDELDPYWTIAPCSITSECRHEWNVCISCVSMSISSQLDQKPLERITCPGCDAQLQTQDFHNLGGDARDKYSKVSAQKYQSEQTHATDAVESVQQGAARPRNPDEVASEAFIATEAKRCPKCDSPGIKVAGCDDMQCPQYKYQYCWLCLVGYKAILQKGHKAHRRFCRYRSAHLHPEIDYEDGEDADDTPNEDEDDVTTGVPGSSAKAEQSSGPHSNNSSNQGPYRCIIACSIENMYGLPSSTGNAFAYNPNEDRPAPSLTTRQHTTHPGHSRAGTPDPSSLHTGIVRREDGQEEDNPGALPRRNAICGKGCFLG